MRKYADFNFLRKIKGEKMKESKIHYGWFVLLALIAMQGGFVGIMINCNGILFSAVIQDLGFRAGDMALYYTIRAIAQAIFVGFTSKLFFKVNPKAFIVAMAVMGGLPFILMSQFNSLKQWYFVAAFGGIAFSSILVIIPIIINNWFVTKKGLVMGISMAASGLAGAVFGPVVSAVITKSGWRTASVFIGIVIIVLISVPVILFLRVTPEEMGLKPYGYVPGEGADSEAGSQGRDYQMPPAMFALALISIITGLIMSQFMNQIPTYAQSIGYTLAVGATISSISMVGNVGGKLLMGVLADKLGIFKTVYLAIGVVLVSMLLFIFGSGSLAGIYAAALLFGLVYSMGTTVPPLVLLEVYGAGQYRGYLSKFQAANAVMCALAQPIFGYIYDFTGSYTMDFVFGVVILTVSMASYMRLKKWSDQIKARQDAAKA